jgi:hypothetical protein
MAVDHRPQEDEGDIVKKSPGNEFADSRKVLQPETKRNTRSGVGPRPVPTGRDRPGPEHYTAGKDPIPPSGRKVGTVRQIGEPR